MRPETPVYKVTQLTGRNGLGQPFGGPDHGKWSVWRLLCYHPGGPAKLITGETLPYAPPSGLWEHMPSVPYFDTQAEAETALEKIKEG